MADFVCQPRFLTDLVEWEKSSSSRDEEAFDRVLAAIVADPELRGRVPNFYDPKRPSYLCRGPSFTVHYRVLPNQKVEFVNLFPYVR